jgi:hypothetical protein
MNGELMGWMRVLRWLMGSPHSVLPWGMSQIHFESIKCTSSLILCSIRLCVCYVIFLPWKIWPLHSDLKLNASFTCFGLGLLPIHLFKMGLMDQSFKAVLRLTCFWKCGLNGRAWSPEVNPQSHQKNHTNKERDMPDRHSDSSLQS